MKKDALRRRRSFLAAEKEAVRLAAKERKERKEGRAPRVAELIVRRVNEIKCQNFLQCSVFEFFAILRGQSKCRIQAQRGGGGTAKKPEREPGFKNWRFWAAQKAGALKDADIELDTPRAAIYIREYGKAIF